MKARLNLNYDLGIRNLLPEWKALLNPRYLSDDIFAGITVAFVAVPLSLAIALASGVPPGVGLITAIVAGIVCAFFGGTPLSVSGPAAAMSILLADIVEKSGAQALVFICLLAGLMQLASGILGLGRLSRYVPLPVIAGFTAGIGFIILVGQLPRAFGLQPPEEAYIFSVFNHINEYFHEINGVCLLLVVVTIAIIRGLPKIFPKVPAILPAVAVTTLLVYSFDLDVPLIGEIPRRLPTPSFPTAPGIDFAKLMIDAFMVYFLASLETLLSASAIDKLSQGKKHQPNQELIGQGMGNIAVSLFGGIPVTGVIARSATNIRSGAKTRRASMIHSVILLLTVFALAPIISQIPIAALAGVLFSVAYSMINYKEFYDLWATDKSEGIIYGVTFFTIIFVDLICGVQAGIVAAALLVLFKVARTHLLYSSDDSDEIMRFSLTGNLTFISTGKIASLMERLSPEKTKTLLLDLSSIVNVDTTGASAIIDLHHRCKELGINFYMKGLSRKFEPFFKVSGGAKLLDECSIVSEYELRKKNLPVAPNSSRGRLVHGVRRFYVERKHNDKRLFDYIKQRQDPHTLFIACSDSRVVPSMITCTDPGELFIIRNVGNFIPPYNTAELHSEVAALEFALSTLDITDIVVCGHANCGAMKACREGGADLPANLQGWIKRIRAQLKIDDTKLLNEIARENVLNQINNLKGYPLVAEKLARGDLNLHAWFFDFDLNLVYEWDHEEADFKSLVGELALA